jgi:hypothetical protein
MRTKLALIAELSERLAECRYEMGRLQIQKTEIQGLSVDQITDLIAYLRLGKTDDVVALLRQSFPSLTHQEIARVLGGSLT